VPHVESFGPSQDVRDEDQASIDFFHTTSDKGWDTERILPSVRAEDRTNAQCTTGTTRVEETLKIFTLLSPPPEAQTVYGPPAGPVNCSPMKTCRQSWSAKQPPGRLFALVVVGRDQIFAIRVRAMPRGFMPI